MAEQKKEKRPIHKTGKGRALYPYLSKPDTKFTKEGLYKTDFVLEGDDADAVIHVVEEALAEAKSEAMKIAKAKKKQAKAADLPYRPELDDDGEETGATIFRFKSKASGTRKDGSRWERKIPLYDSKGRPVEVAIYGGSTLILAYTAEPWVNPKCEYGVKLQLEAVQIIKLVSGGGQRSADAYGFGEEDGYEGGGYDGDEDDAEEDSGSEAQDEDEEDF